MTSLATAFVTIRPDTVGFGTRLSKSVGASADKAGKDAGKRMSKGFSAGAKAMAGAFAGLFAVNKGIDFMKDAVGEAREAQKVGALTTQVIKSTGGAAKVSAKQVSDLAGAISSKTGIDDEAIQSGANLLLTFKNIKNEAGAGNDIFSQTTSIMTDMGAAMGKEPKAAAIQLGKALNDPIKGVTALSRVGVTFDEGQKKVIKRLVETGKTADAQKIILKELRSEFGGAAAASATSGEKAAVAWGNLKEQIGTAVLPVIDKLATYFGTKVVPAISTFVSGMQNGTGAGGKFAAAVGRVKDVVTAVFGFLIRNKETVGAFAGIIVGVAAAVRAWSIAQAILNAVMTASPIGIAVVALAALAAGLVYAYKHFEGFRKVVDTVFNAVVKGAKWLWDVLFGHSIFPDLIRAFGDWKDKVSGFFQKVADKFRAVGGFLRSVAQGVIGFLKKNWPYLLGILTGPIGLATVFIIRHWDTIKSKTKAAWQAMKDIVRLAGLRIVDGVAGMAEKIIGVFAKLPGKMGAPFRTALAKVREFRAGVNAEMDRINDEDVRISLTTIRSATAKNAATLGDRVNRGGKGPIPGAAMRGAMGGVGIIPRVAGNMAGARSAANSTAQTRHEIAMQAAEAIQDKLEVAHKKAVAAASAGALGKAGPGGRVLPRGSYRIGMPYHGYPGHNGADYPAAIGTPVYSPYAGRVTASYDLPGSNPYNSTPYRSYGRVVKLAFNNGMSMLFAHLSSRIGRTGPIAAGTMVGRVGMNGNATGPHLHAEVNGGSVNPASTGLFDRGGILRHGGAAVNLSRKPERILDPRTTRNFERLTYAMDSVASRSGGSAGGAQRIEIDFGGGRTLTGWIREEIGGARAHSATIGRQHR